MSKDEIPLTLNDIIAIADSAYQDGYIGLSWDADTQRPVDGDGAGDTLALFIVRELQDTFEVTEDNETKVLRAFDAMMRAHYDLAIVIEAFSTRMEGAF